MKRKRLHKIIALESADDKVRKQQRVWGKRRKRRREDKEPKVHDTSYLRFTHKSTKGLEPQSVYASAWDAIRETEARQEIIHLTKNDRIRKNLLTLGADMLRIASDPNTAHIP